MKLYFYSIFCCLFSFVSYSQTQYPKDYFSSPLKTPTIFAGTFGELRSNHFHSGVDMKTLGKEGLPIYAPADGYVSRLKVAQYGFGKALYLNHPNGYTTVYAHLQKYVLKIEGYVKKKQYQKQSFYTGNLFPKPNEFPVKKGDIIGYTGNTGSSSGPHLHYEIRDTATEKIINPMHFGLSAKDSINPIIKKLVAFPLNNSSRINKGANKTAISFKEKKRGVYKADNINANGLIGLGIQTFDRLNDANNKNGIHSLEMFVNDKKVYYHDVTTFSFAESKYINLLIDYEYYKKYKNRIQKTHKVNSNKLSLYKDLINNGKINIEEGKNYRIKIVVKDFTGNTSTLELPIRGVKNNVIFKEKDTTAYKINALEFNKFTQKNVTIAFPKNTFYKDCFLDFSVDNKIAKIHEPTIPLDKKYTLTFNTEAYPLSQKEQIYIANITKKKHPYYVNTKRKKNKVYTTTKTLGDYTLKFDNKKPKITLINFKNNQWISSLKTLKVKIKDKESGIKNFNATIDGKWILMEYNHKNGILTYDFSDKKLVGSKHIFKLVVSDNVGNTETISAPFFRK